MLYIHQDECVDCGACEPVCPVEAIYYEADLPAHLKHYYGVNVDFFANIGSPGGASSVGRISWDHPLVASLPRSSTDPCRAGAAGCCVCARGVNVPETQAGQTD